MELKVTAENLTATITKLFIINNDGSATALRDCSVKSDIVKTRDHDGSTYHEEVDGCRLQLVLKLYLKKVNKNHIEKNIKAKNNFITLLKHDEFYPYEAQYALYLNNALIENIKTERYTQGGSDGDTAVGFNDIVTFKPDAAAAVECVTGAYRFYNDYRSAVNECGYNSVTAVADRIKAIKEKQSFFKHSDEKNRASLIKYYEKKQADGYLYEGYKYRGAVVYSRVLTCHGFIEFHEKTAEFKRAESIAADFKKILHEDIYASRVVDLLKVYNISKKRVKKNAQ